MHYIEEKYKPQHQAEEKSLLVKKIKSLLMQNIHADAKKVVADAKNYDAKNEIIADAKNADAWWGSPC